MNRKYIQRTTMIATGKTDYIWFLEGLFMFPCIYFKFKGN